MNNLVYIILSLRNRLLGSFLSIILTAFGVAIALIVLLFTNHLQTRLSNDAQNIDIVIGAKGSPLQIILSSIYHIDIPTGNIPWDDAQRWMNHPQVDKATPLALGDSWKTHWIVGTTPDYLEIYDADFKKGKIWEKPFEAVVGSEVNLAVGEKFAGAHGLIGNGHVHEDNKYIIVGSLHKTNTVLDRLILTSLDSVLEIHGQKSLDPNNHDHDHDHEHEHEHDHANHSEQQGKQEITALLLQTKSPIANMNLPYIINQDGQLQAANPALEMSRLTSMLGVGTKTLSIISTLLILISCFSIFAGIAGNLENRKTDLAILRTLGYSKKRLFLIIAGEGFFLVVLGCIAGAFLSYVGFSYLKDSMQSLSSSGARYSFIPEMIYIYCGAIAAGLFASFLPAYQAAQINVIKQLN